MNAIVSALIALSVLAGVAVPASALDTDALNPKTSFEQQDRLAYWRKKSGREAGRESEVLSHRPGERTAMTARANPSPTDSDDAIGLSRNDRLKALAAYLVTWCETCADYYEAAALYEELSALSDAELHRRGLSRGTLARYVSTACGGR
jgi:hypothetical protein